MQQNTQRTSRGNIRGKDEGRFPWPQKASGGGGGGGNYPSRRRYDSLRLSS